MDQDVQSGPRPFPLTPEAEAEARGQILDCLYRCARGADRGDPELQLTAYHEDAVDDHGFFIGPAREFVGNRLKPANLENSLHYIVNHFVQFDDEKTASVETYWIMGSRTRNDHQARISGGRYLDRFELRKGRWAIAERVCITEWCSDAAQSQLMANFFVQGAQDRTDRSYQRPFSSGRAHRNIDPPWRSPR